MKLGTQLHISPCADLIEKIAPVTNRSFVKPQGGFWTSSYVDGKSAWVDAAEDMKLCDPWELTWFLLEPDPAARVLVIDTLGDLVNLPRAHSFLPHQAMEWPDFERISERWDAMHLTDGGQHRTRLTSPSLYGWDSESTLWFRWCFTGAVRRAHKPDRKPENNLDEKEVEL